MNKQSLPTKVGRKTVILIILVLLGITTWFILTNRSQNNLANPYVSSPTPAPTATPAPPVAPTTYQFDGSTDLEAELEKVNPEVLDSDFE